VGQRPGLTIIQSIRLQERSYSRHLKWWYYEIYEL
jgi:hypothetical protein